jgi:hypothetical protein
VNLTTPQFLQGLWTWEGLLESQTWKEVSWEGFFRTIKHGIKGL